MSKKIANVTSLQVTLSKQGSLYLKSISKIEIRILNIGHSYSVADQGIMKTIKDPIIGKDNIETNASSLATNSFSSHHFSRTVYRL